MIDQPERRTIHVFDLDPETGEVPVRQLHVVGEADATQRRTSIVRIDLSKALAKLDRVHGGHRLS